MMIKNYDNKLDNMCYNNILLISFLPLWVPSVNAYLLKTGPEACSERETDAPSPHSHRPPEHGSPGSLPCLFTTAKTERNLKSFYFEHYYIEKAQIAVWRGLLPHIATW